MQKHHNVFFFPRHRNFLKADEMTRCKAWGCRFPPKEKPSHILQSWRNSLRKTVDTSKQYGRQLGEKWSKLKEQIGWMNRELANNEKIGTQRKGEDERKVYQNHIRRDRSIFNSLLSVWLVVKWDEGTCCCPSPACGRKLWDSACQVLSSADDRCFKKYQLLLKKKTNSANKQVLSESLTFQTYIKILVFQLGKHIPRKLW